MSIPSGLIDASQRASHVLAESLSRLERKVVFAESCTAGLVSALLAQVPGISQWMCGSAVTYMAEVKTEWLGVPANLIEQHTAVSPQASEALAGQVLAKTPIADLSVGITGHLEPSAAPHDQPFALIGLAERCGDQIVVSPIDRFDLLESTRVARQWQAAWAVLDRLAQHVQQINPIGQQREPDGCPRCRQPGHRDWTEWSPF